MSTRAAMSRQASGSESDVNTSFHCPSPSRYFGTKYHKAPHNAPNTTNAGPLVGQLDFHSVHRPMRNSPPAKKLSTPRQAGTPTWGSLGNIRRRNSPRLEESENATAPAPAPSIMSIDGDVSSDQQEAETSPPPAPIQQTIEAPISVTKPETEIVFQSVPAFRRDPYSPDYSVVQVQPMQVEVEVLKRTPVVFPTAPPAYAMVAGARPPLAPPAPRSVQQSVRLANLHLATNLRTATTLATPRGIHRLNSSTSESTSSTKGAAGLTPRSARSDLSTPRDLPESVDGPYRNLGGLGVDPQPGEVVHQTPRQEADEKSTTPGQETLVEMMPANAQGRNMPLPPAGTLHQELMTVVDFCKYPTRAFPLKPESESPPKEEMVRMFIGQLPYNVTDMQLGWIAYAFGGGVQLHHFERITKLDRTKRKQLPTGCFHFYVESQYVDSLTVGVHKKLLVDDTGIWVAKDEKQDRILKTYSEQMKNDRTKRFEGRPYGTVVIQHSTSSFGLGGSK